MGISSWTRFLNEKSVLSLESVSKKTVLNIVLNAVGKGHPKNPVWDLIHLRKDDRAGASQM
jgi:beta-lactamase class A